jgi:hypothetical protein
MPRYNAVALQRVIDELGNPELGGRQLRSIYAVVSLLLGRQLDEAALSTDASSSRLETRLREESKASRRSRGRGTCHRSRACHREPDYVSARRSATEISYGQWRH